MLLSWSRGAVLAIGVIGLLMTLAACDESVERMLRDAQALHDGGNLPAAAHKVEAILTRDPTSIPGRLLAAQISIELSQGNAALGLVLRAQQDGATQQQTGRLLIEAELVAHHYDDVVRDTANPLEGFSAADRASLLAYRAAALEGLGRQGEAQATLQQGLALDAHSVDLHIAAVRIAIGRHAIETARSALEEAVHDAPADRRLPELRGDVAYAAQEYDAAADIYRNVLQKEPWNELIRGELGAVLLAQDKVTEAIGVVDKALTRRADAPKLPILNYIRAVGAFRQRDYEVAQTNAAQVIKVAPQFSPAWLIAGAASYALNANEQAYYYLSPYVSQNPGDSRASSLLAETQLRLGRVTDAVNTLAPLRDKARGNPDLLGLIGLAASRSGDPATAQRYFKLALQERPEDQQLRGQLGLAEIAAGDPKTAVETLEPAVRNSPDSSGPQLPLFIALLQTKEFDKALGIADQVAKQQPTSPTGELLAAAVHLSQGDPTSARAALLQARALDPGNVSANTNLAKLALADGKLEEAQQHLRDIIAAHRDSVATYIALAELDIRTGHLQDAETLLSQGADANPTDAAPRIALLRLQLSRGEVQQALDGGHDALKTFPRNPALLDITGRAELGVGHPDAALSTFHDLTDIVPQASWAHTDLAEAYLALDTPQNPQWGSVNEAELAVQLNPKDMVAKLVLGRALAMHDRFEEAAQIARDLRASAPNDVGAIELDALVARGQGRLADAENAFERAVAANDNAVDRRRLADTQGRLGHTNDAIKTLADWVGAHPGDIATRKMLAETYARAGRLAEAREQYGELTSRVPKDAEVQNNYAWVLSRQGEIQDALSHARTAVDLAPNVAEYRDTLGTVLLQAGNAADAVPPLDQAWRNAGDRPHIGYHLSEALVAAGRKDEAITLLRDLLAGSKPFVDRSQAEQLLHRLGG